MLCAADVTPEMDIAQEETFGPIMTVMRAVDDADAIRIVSTRLHPTEREGV